MSKNKNMPVPFADTGLPLEGEPTFVTKFDNGDDAIAELPESVTEPVIDLADILGTVQTGDVSEFTSALKARKSWDWDTFKVGQFKTVSLDDFPAAMSSAHAMRKGTAGTINVEARLPMTFRARAVEVNTAEGRVTVKQIMRIA